MPLITSEPLFHLPYLVIWVVYSEVAHTNDDFVQQSFTGMLRAVPQQGADNVPEGQGQPLSSHNRLKNRPRNTNHTPAACSRTCVNCIHINCTLLGCFCKDYVLPCERPQSDFFFQLLTVHNWNIILKATEARINSNFQGTQEKLDSAYLTFSVALG